MRELKYFNNYYITTCGKVISKKTNKVISTYIDTVGYKCVTLKNKNKYIHIRIHRLMGFAFLGVQRYDYRNQINHIDGNKLNCYLNNLEVISNKGNTEHGYDNNLYTTRNRISIKVYNNKNNKYFICKSMRECEKITGINRKKIKSYIDGIITNTSDYIFTIIDCDIPFRIKDSIGNDFRSCRQCSIYYGFDEGNFNKKCKNSKYFFVYKNIKFEKYCM